MLSAPCPPTARCHTKGIAQTPTLRVRVGHAHRAPPYGGIAGNRDIGRQLRGRGERATVDRDPTTKTTPQPRPTLKVTPTDHHTAQRLPLTARVGIHTAHHRCRLTARGHTKGIG